MTPAMFGQHPSVRRIPAGSYDGLFGGGGGLPLVIARLVGLGGGRVASP
jgi:hypothetical protein